eukprot:TRINITY_DN70016_c0_g1_i1.p2 TRINITY_DN70016_c0_g1~~TRINITY_DN70016_c0_g1_i1.p2  ORF type:complete len:175 (+),score=45.04 TRINITY_DN70016_c0_g1_i1:68-526(+)
MAAMQRANVLRGLPQGSYASGRSGNLYADTPLATTATTARRNFDLYDAGTGHLHVTHHDSNRVLGYQELEDNVGSTFIDDGRLRELFDQYDTDGSGFLELDEVRRLYESFDNVGVEYSDADLKREIGRYAQRDDGKVDFDEFCCILLSISRR